MQRFFFYSELQTGTGSHVVLRSGKAVVDRPVPDPPTEGRSARLRDPGP